MRQWNVYQRDQPYYVLTQFFLSVHLTCFNIGMQIQSTMKQLINTVKATLKIIIQRKIINDTDRRMMIKCNALCILKDTLKCVWKEDCPPVRIIVALQSKVQEDVSSSFVPNFVRHVYEYACSRIAFFLVPSSRKTNYTFTYMNNNSICAPCRCNMFTSYLCDKGN